MADSNTDNKIIDLGGLKHFYNGVKQYVDGEINDLKIQIDSSIPELNLNTKILWLGTSIPYGIDYDPNNNYPRLVSEGLGCTVYNNAKPGSFLSYYSNDGLMNATSADEVDNGLFALGYSLTQTIQEAENKYRSKLNTLRRSGGRTQAWVDDYITSFREHSYENLVIPYINGDLDDCDVVIIDHGFNDRDNIFNISAQHPHANDILSYWPPEAVGGATNIEYPVTSGNAGWFWINNLANSSYYDGLVYMNTVRAIGASGDGSLRGEYPGAMAYLIEQIWKVNPRIKIIIGNYFSLDSGIDTTSSFKTRYILAANESIANYYGIQCVNPYKYTGLRNFSFTTNDGVTATDMIRFCPDGVHPGSDTTGKSNKVIANVYIDALRYIV